MKTYKRSPFLKVIDLFFIIAHMLLGLKMIYTDFVTLGVITMVTGLYWVYSFINEFAPYLKMDEHKLLFYKSIFTKPQEFDLNKNTQMYYHSKERLVFTYLNSGGVKSKAKIFLGYMSPSDSMEFVQEFRAILAKYQVNPLDDIKKPAEVKAARKSKGRPKKKKEAEAAAV